MPGRHGGLGPAFALVLDREHGLLVDRSVHERVIDLRHFLRARLDECRRDDCCCLVRGADDDLLRGIEPGALGGSGRHKIVESCHTLGDDDADRIPGQRRGHEHAEADRHENPRARRSGELKDVERGKGAPDSSERGRLTHSSLRQSENDRQQEDHSEEENHPRSVFALAKAPEESQRMRGGSDRKERGGRPAEEQSDRAREQGSDPAEVSLYVAVAVELSVALGGECAGEEDPE